MPAAPPPALRPSYPTERRLTHRHCGRCGAAVRGRRVVDVTGPPPPHRCATTDLMECAGCGAAVVRRLQDWVALNPDLSPHGCGGDEAERGYQADLAEGIETGQWPWYARERAEREEADRRERDEEAEQYDAWLRYRRAMGIPDRGEGELP